MGGANTNTQIQVQFVETNDQTETKYYENNSIWRNFEKKINNTKLQSKQTIEMWFPYLLLIQNLSQKQIPKNWTKNLNKKIWTE